MKIKEQVQEQGISMFEILASRRNRSILTATVLAMTGATIALSAGSAHAASGVPIGIDFSKTKIQSVKIFAKTESGPWVGGCVSRDPYAVVTDTGFKAETEQVIIASYVTRDCAGDKLHEDSAPTADKTAWNWVVPVQELDDDDPIRWTA